MRCYLAGGMRGRSMDATRSRFNRAATQLRHVGWSVLNPASHGFDKCRTQADYDAVIDRDLGMIRSLDPDRGDALVLLPGWELSTGARCEKAFAEWRRLRVLMYEEAINEREGEELI